MRLVDFANMIIVTDRPEMFENETVIEIPPEPSWEGMAVHGYGTFSEIRELYSGHTMIVQADGYIVKPEAWEGAFLQYDYIGAPFVDTRWNNVVGNSGFSLQSRHFWDCVDAIKPELTVAACHPFDSNICVRDRYRLEAMGVQFCDPDTARRFSIENAPYNGSFGFHGNVTMATLPEGMRC